MKRMILAFFVIFLIVSCATKELSRPIAEGMAPEDTVGLWISSIEQTNLDKLLSVYWQDAVMVIHRRDEPPVEIPGIDRIRQRQNEIFGRLMKLDTIIIDEVHRDPASPDTNPLFIIHIEGTDVLHFLMLTQRENVWKIQKHTLEPTGMNQVISGKYQAWADFNGNRQLEPEEMETLVIAVRHLLSQPHDVETPLDEMFDLKPDRFIDPGELERARQKYFGFIIHRFGEEYPELSRELFDLNGDGRSDPEERRFSLEIIFNLDEFKNRDDIPPEVIRLLDRNRDGRVEEFEVRDTGYIILEKLALAPLEERSEMVVSRDVGNYLDELADINGDGMVDADENMMLKQGLSDPHPVNNPFDERLDTNHNGRVEAFEIVRARRAGNLAGGGEKPELVEFYPAKTLADKALDLNEDNRVSRDEIESVIRFFLQPYDVDSFPRKLTAFFDLNGDRKVSASEFREGRSMFIQPHPVNSDRATDLRLDEDNDGFVAPHEIGIAAGVSPAGPAVPFEVLVERLRWDAVEFDMPDNVQADKQDNAFVVFEEEIVKRLESMEDKKLAVVGLNNQVENLSKQTTDGLVVFVENAFVNVGKVKVVDRQNIAKIMAEQKFQLSGITDESTAVEIGKLAGADIIVIGSMSYVGSMYYLNIKMIGVETAQILGSSISQASSDTGFLGMCNEAVYKLFLE